MRELLFQADADAVLWLCLRRRRGLDRFMRLVSHLGDGWLWLAVGVLLSLNRPDVLQTAGRIVLAFGIELLAYRLIKNGVSRRRPFVAHPLVTGLVIPPDEFSFPSGHTAAAMVMTVIVTHALPPLGPLFLTLGLLIGVSRVYLGVHYPSDILAGALLGSLAGMVGVHVL